MNVAMFPNQSGSRYWRLEDPAKYLREEGIDAQVVNTGIDDEVAKWADIVVLQSCVDMKGIALLRAYQKERGLKIIVDADDHIKINDDNPHKIEHEATNAPEVIAITMRIADAITTTTTTLAKALRAYNDNVCVLPNYMNIERWDLPKLTNESDTIRIGWAGSVTHLKDMEMIEKPLKRIMDEFSQVRLVLVGDPRVGELFKGYPVETMLGVDFHAWPPRLSGLRLDIGLAPLIDSEFNRNKSNIKWMEYGINKVPGVFSKIVYWRKNFDGKLGLVAETPQQWYQCLKNLITNDDLRHDIGENAYFKVRTRYDLMENISEWIDCYSKVLYNRDS